MRLINLDGRLHIQRGPDAFDVHAASEGRFDADPQAVYGRWDEFVEWAASASLDGTPVTVDPAGLGAPAPRPRQILAIGLNYDEHAAESGYESPTDPVVFTKFVSSLTGPQTTVTLPKGSVDWEVELVAVVGRGGRDIARDDAWSHVAGLTIGQDLSERQRQLAGPAPQFSLGKSHAGFAPTGPALVTVDEVGNPDDLEIGAEIDGENVQHGRTSNLIFPVSALVAYLSSVVELYPGDLIFTGTPPGVGQGRTPQRFLQPGNVLRSYIEGLGEITQTFVA